MTPQFSVRLHAAKPDKVNENKRIRLLKPIATRLLAVLSEDLGKQIAFVERHRCQLVDTKAPVYTSPYSGLRNSVAHSHRLDSLTATQDARADCVQHTAACTCTSACQAAETKSGSLSKAMS